MASSKIMKSSNTRNSDLSKRFSSTSTKPQQQQALTDASNFASAMTVDGILRNVYNTTTASTTDATLLDAQITLIETNANTSENDHNGTAYVGEMKSVEDVWREIVSGEKKEMKEEAVDEMMTLEDYLAKAEAVEDAAVAPVSPFQVEGAIVGFSNGVEVVGGRGKRGRVMLEPLDKAAQQRQRRMIKNRESAARSRERKQAYQVELESLAVRLEEENEQLLKEKAERTKERYKQLMENVVPVVEKKRQPRVLRRVRSIEW